MQVELDDVLINMIKNYPERRAQHYGYCQLGQADDLWSFNQYKEQILNELVERVRGL